MRLWITAAAAAVAVLVAGCATEPARTAGTAKTADGPVHPAATVTARPRLATADSARNGSCPVGSAKAVIILTDTLPAPVVIVPVRAIVVVTVPRWSSGRATVVNAAVGGILREECTVLLPGGGRRTVFQSLRPGSTFLGASVEPASDTFMPAWSGTVIVRGTLIAGLPSVQVSPGTP
jgi:hypothetical protein